MLFWVLCAVLTAVVLYAVMRPLSAPLARSTERRDVESDLAVYRDQLRELEADRARGLLTDAEAEAARVEISRRLLARAEAVEPVNGGAPAASRLDVAKTVYVSAAILVPAISLSLYLAFGSPGLPGQPHAERMATAPEKT